MAILGGGLLIAFGLGSIFLKPPIIQNDKLIIEKVSLLSLFIRGFVINTFNPFTVFFWIILSGKLSIEKGLSSSDAIMFYVGLYTMLISTDALKVFLAKKIQQRITPEILLRIKQLLGVALLICGIVLIIRAFLDYFK
jgi:threonine/homoserine/homoserine lactone efflux protein